MADKPADLDVETRLRGYLAAELRQATADFAPHPLKRASTVRTVALVIPSLVAVLIVAVVVASKLLAPAPLPVGGSGTVGPGASPPTGTPAASHPANPTSSPAVLAYPDGLPMELGGEHVYRPNDPIVVSGGREILVTGWIVGWIVASCPLASPPPGTCPRSAQLADSPGGPTMLVVRWPSSADGLGVVVGILPTDQGCGDGEQSCVAPTVIGTEVLWVAPSDVASPGGTCSASQFVLGTPVDGGPGFGTLGTSDDFVTVPLRDLGDACVLNLPTAITVASADGPFQAVKVVNAGLVTAFSVPAGGNVSIVLGDSWPIHPGATGGGAPARCAAIIDATRARIPFASGSLQVALGTVWPEVCPDPPSISMTFITK